MNQVVCLKQVPDTASAIRVVDGQVDREGLDWVVNPYDEYALEEALQIRERRGGEGKITVVTVGAERAAEALRSGLALGADEAVHLADPAFEDLDPFGVAQVLAASLPRIEYDLIWFGWKGVDHDHGIVGAAVAELLDLPQVSFVIKVEIAEDGKTGRLEKEVEGAHQVVETSLPAVLTAQKGLNEPRYPSLKGIMAVKNKPIAVWSAEDVGLDAQALAPRMELVSAALPPQREAGRLIEGSAEEQARDLVRILREEAKVI